jgi:hypothetical protein
MPWLDLPSAIAASTSRSRGLSRSTGLLRWRRPSIRPHDLGVEGTPTPGDAGDRVDEALDIADTLLEEIADSFRTLPDQVKRVLLLVILREHEHARLGPLASQLDRRAQAVVSVPRRHVHIGDHDRRPPGGGRDPFAADRWRHRPAQRRRIQPRRAAARSPHAAARRPRRSPRATDLTCWQPYRERVRQIEQVAMRKLRETCDAAAA